MDEMQEYIQEILDLIEYANGPVTSTWGAKRAAAGHPKSFNLQYLGVGNEDKITPAFTERFKLIYDAVRIKHPEITVIGTVGPAPSGEDFEQGWKVANELTVPIVDEHYYEKPEWFLDNSKRYDAYNREASQVYLGEYASRGNKLFNALAEAAYMTSLERNGDVVKLASYAPLLARKGHTQWNPNLIYFTGTQVCPTVNYYVQQLFSVNQGDVQFSNVISSPLSDSVKNTLATSCVKDTKTGDIILKLVNASTTTKQARVNLSGLGSINRLATSTILTGDSKMENTCDSPQNIVPKTSDFRASKLFTYDAPANSLTVIRIKTTSGK
jgi:alpha-L-arabinofuranosidase